MEIDDIKEKLAELAHDQWSGWMEYLFSKCNYDPITGTMTIPEWAVDRWERQMRTPYDELSEEEKNNDREEAQKFLDVITNLFKDMELL